MFFLGKYLVEYDIDGYYDYAYTNDATSKMGVTIGDTAIDIASAETSTEKSTTSKASWNGLQR